MTAPNASTVGVVTAGPWPAVDPLVLAKALHPAHRTRRPPQQPNQVSREFHHPLPSAVIWNEGACRAQLASFPDGWLSYPGHHEQLAVTVIAVEGPDIVLLAPGNEHLSGSASEGTARLDVGGVTANSCRWRVSATGSVRSVISSEPPQPTHTADRFHNSGASRPAEGNFSLLALTLGGIHGFQNTPEPARG